MLDELKPSLLIPTLLFFGPFISDSRANVPERDAFVISSAESTAEIIVHTNEEEVVHTAVEMFAHDVLSVSGHTPAIESISDSPYQIRVGTLGLNRDFDRECAANAIDIDGLNGRWEAYVIRVIRNDDKHILYVVGSQSRGTAYGLMELSRRIGISPWIWWADVHPQMKTTVTVPGDLSVQDGPKVRFRGIFINDEDWGLRPWASKTFEPEVGNIGPKTYAKVFELLIRLKANAIWPAMHPGTTPFFDVKGNEAMARKYGIVVGSSHAEPMLRNNVGEWHRKTMGDFNYVTNRDSVYNYWKRRVMQVAGDHNIYTIGMRGVHDSRMEGAETLADEAAILSRVFEDQRGLLRTYVNPDVTRVPQVFIPYKEVLPVYDYGLKVPDDVTLVWPDDNHGYIRRLSDAKERQRSGGAGVYYHLSYWGRPHDFLWLESVPVSLVWEEMNKAYHTNAKDVWIANVGDIKPIEIGMNFFLEMAWDPDQFSPENLTSYYTRFAAVQFGDTYAKEIGEILRKYFQLAFSRKPEHMGWTRVYPNTPIQDPGLSLFCNGDEVQQRLDGYSNLEERVENVQNRLPEQQRDAFYQLVAYKVLGASNMNKKLLYAYKSRVYAEQGRVSANAYAEKSRQAYEKIQEITTDYNNRNNGKWMRMMSCNPRGLPVFGEPEVGHVAPTRKTAGGVIPEGTSQPAKPGAMTSLPTFLSSTDRRYFIDVFNSGREPLTWKANVKDKWIQLSSMGGTISTDERIWVSVDWSRMKSAAGQAASIEFKVGDSVYPVEVKAQRVQLPADSQLFVEENDVVAMEAEHFNHSQDTANGNWRLIQGLGRQNDAVGTFPVTAGALNVSQGIASALYYEIFTRSAGQATLRFYCLPSQPLNRDYRLRFAVSIDDGEPLIMDAALKEAMDEYNEEWQTNVLRAVNVIQKEITIPQSGRHRIKISMIDPGVVLDKIEVMMSNIEKMNSYFGSSETEINTGQRN